MNAPAAHAVRPRPRTRAILALLCGLASEAASQTFDLTRTLNIDGTEPIVRDFDQDGRLDLAVLTAVSGVGVVSVQRGDGSGGFGPASNYLVGGPGGAYSAEVGDLNRDGALDLVLVAVGFGDPQPIAVLLGNGAGGFGAPTRLSAGLNSSLRVVDLALGDFNGDGKLDLAAAGGSLTSSLRNVVAILLGDGSGGFGSPRQTTIASLGTVDIVELAPVDTNADGRLDLALCTTRKVVFLTGDGTGGFAISETEQSAQAIIAGDLNRDGRTDLVGIRDVAYLSGRLPILEVRLGRATGGFGPPRVSPIRVLQTPSGGQSSSLGRLVLADANNDGNSDVVFTFGRSENADVFFVVPGDGEGGFRSPIGLGSGWRPAEQVAVADLNADGRNEIVVPNVDSRILSVFTMDSTGHVAGARGAQVYAAPADLTIGDFNLDGVPDVAVASEFGPLAASGNSTVSVLLGRGDGGYEPPNSYTVGVGASSVHAADLDRDGIPDLVAVNRNTTTISVLLGRGAGVFGAETQYSARPSTSWSNAGRGVIADFNGDGNVDVATTVASVASSTDTRVSLLLGSGDGKLGAPTLISTGRSPTGLGVADLNADGRADLIMANLSSAELSVLLGNGDATFAPAVHYPLGSVGFGVVLGDLNGDSRIDAAVPTSSGIAVLLGSGSGGFGAATTYPGATWAPNGIGPSSVAIGDLDRDGIPDLVVGLSYTVVRNDPVAPHVWQFSTLRGLGAGAFAAPTLIPGPYRPGRVALADMNRDGTLDILVGGYRGSLWSYLGTSGTTPTLTITDASVTEGRAGSKVLKLGVQLLPTSTQTVMVDFKTESGTATSSLDYTGISGTLSFSPGERSRSIDIPIVGDSKVEGDERFSILLSNPWNAALAVNRATVTILDDESFVAISDGRIKEANFPSLSPLSFTVSLSSSLQQAVLVGYETAPGTATAGSDYQSAAGVVVFPPGVTTQTVSVSVVGDNVAESNEGFGVSLAEPANATLSRAVGQGVIIDDDTVASSNPVRPQPSWQEFFAVDTLETPYVGDFNGDRKTDIITFTRQNPNAIGDVYVALSDGAKFGANTKWHDFFAITTDESVIIGDYNGDGKDDIATWLGKASRQVYVALSTGSGMLTESAWVNSIGTDATDLIFAGDANGDGKDDLIAFARKQGKVYVAISDGTKFATPAVWHGFFAVSTYERPRVADVNGDGKADIVTFATDSPTAFGDVYVATSDGTQFVGPTGAPNDSSKWHDFFAIRPTEEIRIGDLNGDGKDDFFTFLPPPFAQAYSVLSQGTSMADNALWAEAVAPLLGAGDNVYVGDVNGDSKADIIIFAQKEGKVFVSLAP